MNTQWSSRNSMSSMPYYWKRRICIEDLSETLSHIEQSQVPINDLYLNEDEETLQNRADVVSWIFSISRDLNLKTETVFRCVHILDQYLAQSGKVARIQSMDELHFTTVVCLNLAAKMEEINCNYLKYFQENLTNFTLKDFIQKELEVLKVLKYKLSSPTVNDFMNIFLQVSINEINSFYATLSNRQSFKVEMDQMSNARHLITSLITFNNKISNQFLQMKESVFTSQIASGLICFQASLLAQSQILQMDMTSITDLIMKKIKFIINDDELLNNCHFIAYNFLLSFTQDSKYQSGSKTDNSNLSYDL